MRMFGASALRVCLLCAVAGSASAGCKVDVVFQHAPKHTNHFEQVLARAENGDPTAQFQAAVALETGEGTAQDYAAAVKWYRRAADAGSAAAQNNLGGMYLRGLGVAQDDREALGWYSRAAGEGYLPAENNVGFMKAAGRGTQADDEDAVRWYRRAAEKGYAPAQANLAFMYSMRRAAGWVSLSSACLRLRRLSQKFLPQRAQRYTEQI